MSPEWTPDWSVHPGEILREELKARGITQALFASDIQRPAKTINRIIKGKTAITADTALDLEDALGISAQFWARLQAEHDVWVARQRRGGAKAPQDG